MVKRAKHQGIPNSTSFNSTSFDTNTSKKPVQQSPKHHSYTCRVLNTSRTLNTNLFYHPITRLCCYRENFVVDTFTRDPHRFQFTYLCNQFLSHLRLSHLQLLTTLSLTSANSAYTWHTSKSNEHAYQTNRLFHYQYYPLCRPNPTFLRTLRISRSSLALESTRLCVTSRLPTAKSTKP